MQRVAVDLQLHHVHALCLLLPFPPHGRSLLVWTAALWALAASLLLEFLCDKRAHACDSVFAGCGNRPGKTYAALQRLQESAAGVYCGPLRLLALEVHETLNRQGVYTDLLTGQVR